MAEVFTRRVEEPKRRTERRACASCAAEMLSRYSAWRGSGHINGPIQLDGRRSGGTIVTLEQRRRTPDRQYCTVPSVEGRPRSHLFQRYARRDAESGVLVDACRLSGAASSRSLSTRGGFVVKTPLSVYSRFQTPSMINFSIPAKVQ